MDIRFVPVEAEKIWDSITAHNASLPSPIDSFAEDHILSANHYEITVDPPQGGSPDRADAHGGPPDRDGVPTSRDRVSIGYCSVHAGSTLTQFVVDREYGAAAQQAFFAARRLESVQEALVATCDEGFLSHSLDDHREVLKQAYFFRRAHDGAGGPDRGTPHPHRDIVYRLVEPSELDMVRQHSADFFDDVLEEQLSAGQIHLGSLEGEPVTFGIVEPGRLLKSVASIGMFTKPEYRRKGIGRSTLLYLSGYCRERSLEPIAGCWYYNHLSKKTLESAGFVSKTRYLRVRF